MKTFTKVLSMILVGVMCFTLLASSAYAFEFNTGDNQSADFGGSEGGFTFGGGESGFTFGGGEIAASNGDFSLDTPQQPAAQDNGFALNSNNDQQPAAQTEEKEELFTFTVEDNATFDKRYDTADSYTFKVNPSSIDKSNPQDVVISSTGTQIEPDTFDSYCYTKSGSFINQTAISEGNLKKEVGKITLKKEWLKTLSEGTYYLWGVPALGAPVYLGYIQVNAGTYNLYLNPSTYTKQMYKSAYDDSLLISITGNINAMERIGIVPVNNTSGGQILSGLNWTNNGAKITLSRDFLNSLAAGEYYVVGFPSSSNSEQVQADKRMIIKEPEDTGSPLPWDSSKTWSLTPDYSSIAWTSGDDYLVFWSDLMALRNYTKDYTIILRYGYGAGSIPTKEVGYNQFWHFDNGSYETFALGTNFLNSLPSGVYTLQVVEMKHGWCTNTVEFRIGSKLVPIDSDKHVINSIRNLRFLCDEPIAQVYVGNIPLTYGEDYALSANGKTVTLSYEFLNKRSAGNTYTLKVLTTSGDYCSTTFQILTTAQGGASPRTGDESNLGLWAAFLLLSGTAVVILLPKLKKHGM